jgi:UDP-N-acetyl-D-galactosamine dehydrogenase
MVQEILKDLRVCIVGLGYVGMPLAYLFAKNGVKVYGFDINSQRIANLKNNLDPNQEVSSEEMATVKIEYSSDPAIIKKANFIIAAIPTPVDKHNIPDLSLVKQASETIGQNLAAGSIVVYESTVYPGVTEDICGPILAKASGLVLGKDFYLGYSPERVNPGDREHGIDKIIKVVSGMNDEVLEVAAQVYGIPCQAGVHRAPNIKTAEAAKVIENIQRDLNIALMNELSLIFHRLGINTREVIEAAGTKWNFHKYQPGLVGGHCIGVDPYYLTFCAQGLGYHPEVILAGRRINDGMSEYVADLTIQGLVEAGQAVKSSKVLVLGLTFKENVRDARNSRIKYTIKKLHAYGIKVLGYDPNLTSEQVKEFGAEYVDSLEKVEKVDGIIISAIHNQYKDIKLADLIKFFNGENSGVLVDIKSWFLPAVKAGEVDNKKIIYKSL